MYAKKIIISAESTLALKYGKNMPKIKRMLQSLKRSDKKRGIATTVVYIDDKLSAKRAGIKAIKNVNPRECKQAVDDLYKKHVPDYMVLVGAQDVFPFQDINNPADEDGDLSVPSDLPYACDAPYSRNIQSFTGPTRVVGRIPDVPGVNDLQHFSTAIHNIIHAKPRKEELYLQYFGVSAYVWRKSTQLSIQHIVGNYDDLLLSPGASPNYTPAQLKKLTHFFNCHGAQNDMAFYGQKGNNYPVAISSTQLSGKISEGTIVAAECCYGAELVNPTLLPQPNALSIANTYLINNAVAFMGSSNIAYGPADSQGLADLITQYFLKNILNGASTGRALLQARQQFLTESGPHLDPYELKTLAQFYLLGDPSVLPVIDETVKKTVSQNTVQNTRMKLFNKGKELQENLAPSQKQRVITRSVHQKNINKLLQETGFSANDLKGVYKASVKTRSQNITEKNWDPVLRGSVLSLNPALPGEPPVSIILKCLWLKNRMSKYWDGEFMSDDKKHSGKIKEIQLSGKVVKKRVAKGSKSEREAILLQTKDTEYILRKWGGNPFRDASLEMLTGKHITATGILDKNLFLVKDIRVEG